MRGIEFKGNSIANVIDFPDIPPGPEQVLIKLRSSGLCGSDFMRYRADGSKWWLNFMEVIDIHAHIVFEETLNFLDKEGPEIGGDEKTPWFRVGDYKLEGHSQRIYQ